MNRFSRDKLQVLTHVAAFPTPPPVFSTSPKKKTLRVLVLFLCGKQAEMTHAFGATDL
ncbi:MAG: hypothetical protein OXI43_12735 [Candidatus Poribacteria bacterium]|nr:hypothetical protein [Candidatus Poribacteria bacterium]